MANFLTMYVTRADAVANTNALAVPTPSYSSAKQTVSTLVNSGRSALNGQLYAQRVGDRDLSKLELLWKYLTSEQWSDILKKINSGTQGFYIWIKYFDMQSNAWRIREFYPSDRQGTPFIINKTTKEIKSYLDCSVNFIDTGAEEIIII